MRLTSDSIGFKLLKVVLSIYFVITLVITSLHVYLEYSNVKKHITQNIQTIVTSFETPLSKAIWGFNNNQIQVLKQSMLNLNIISHLELFNEHNEPILPLYIFDRKGFISFKKQIFMDDINGKHYVGYAKVYYDKELIFKTLKESFLIILINAAIKTFILITLFTWAFQKYLLRHLHHITEQINEVDFESIGDKKLASDQNYGEINTLIVKFNKMIDKLSSQKQKSIEQQNLLITQNKLAAMGRLIEQIAHQWRQPLNLTNGILGGLKFRIDNNLYDGEFFSTEIKKGEHAIQYLSMTIEDFMNFYKEDRNRKVDGIDSVIASNINILEQVSQKEKITIEYNNHYSKEVIVYGNEISHVIFNLLNNSIEALTAQSLEDRYIFIDLDSKDEFIEILFKDSARGVDESILDKLFEPYFSTKTTKKGTGLGLYMCYEIISTIFEGSIVCKNVNYQYKTKDLKGLEFKISIPRYCKLV